MTHATALEAASIKLRRVLALIAQTPTQKAFRRIVRVACRIC